MEILESFAGTFNHVYSAIKVGADLKEELDNLNDKIENAESLLKPLRDPDGRAGLPTETLDLYLKLEQTISSAKDTSSRLVERQASSSSGWQAVKNVFTLRPRKELEDLIGLSEKIASQANFLSASLIHATTRTLAKTSSSKTTPKRRGPQAKRRASTEEMESDESSLAHSVIKHAEARKFWIQHFGADEYSSSWRRFSDAIWYEYFSSLARGKSRSQFFDNLKESLDATSDSEVSIYAWAGFTADTNKTVYQLLHSVMQESEENQAATEFSPRKARARMLLRTTTQLHISRYSEFELELFGAPEITNNPDLAQLLHMRFASSEKAEIGRAMFAALPPRFLGHISRKHCVIERMLPSGDVSEEEQDRKPIFQVTDCSGNGTILNGKLLRKNVPTRLAHGDRLTILYEPQRDGGNTSSPTRGIKTIIGFVFLDPSASPFGRKQSLGPSPPPSASRRSSTSSNNGSTMALMPVEQMLLSDSSHRLSLSRSRSSLGKSMDLSISSISSVSPASSPQPSSNKRKRSDVVQLDEASSSLMESHKRPKPN